MVRLLERCAALDVHQAGVRACASATSAVSGVS
jgi:hypothetical protein